MSAEISIHAHDATRACVELLDLTECGLFALTAQLVQDDADYRERVSGKVTLYTTMAALRDLHARIGRVLA